MLETPFAAVEGRRQITLRVSTLQRKIQLESYRHLWMIYSGQPLTLAENSRPDTRIQPDTSRATDLLAVSPGAEKVLS